MKTAVRIAGALALAALCGACADDAPSATSVAPDAAGAVESANATARPPAPGNEDAGLFARFADVEKKLQAEVAEEIRSGFVAMVLQDGAIVDTAVVGLADREAGVPMAETTRFRIASMTKPVTSVAILMLADDGALSLNDPLAKFLPSFAGQEVATSVESNGDDGFDTEPLARPIAIRDLLTHTSGLGYVFDGETDLGKTYLESNLFEMEGDLAARIEALATLPLYRQPGEEWLYSYATDVLGRVVEVASGQPLETFMRTRIFEPLGMTDTEFLIDASDLDRAAVVYAHDEDGAIVRYAGGSLGADPNENGAGWAAGGAGLISTAADYLAFCRFLIDNGVTRDGERLLSEKGVNGVFDSAIPYSARPEDWRKDGMSFSLAGWVMLANPADREDQTTTGAFGWGGYYDTSFAINRTEKSAYVVMAQREPGPNDKPSKAGEIMRGVLFGGSARQ